MKEFCYNCDKVTEMEEIEEVFDEDTSVTNKAFNARSVAILTYTLKSMKKPIPRWKKESEILRIRIKYLIHSEN